MQLVKVKTITGGFLVILFIILIGITIYQDVVQVPVAGGIEKALRVDLNNITPLPGATLVGTLDDRKSNQAFVENRYNSTLAVDQIYSYYNNQLVKLGWQFYQEKSTSYKGKDYGDKEFVYKKGYHVAMISYTGLNPNLPQTFAISISWGLDF